MQIVYKKLEELKPYENNPRLNDDAVEYVKKSIEEFGFKIPMVIDSNNVIVCGHTRYKASKELGIEEVPCIIADDLTDEQIKAFRLADNKVSDYSIWDNKKLLEELEGLDDIFTGFETSDFFYDELDETNFDVLEQNESGVEYIITLKSQNKEKVDKFIDDWNNSL